MFVTIFFAIDAFLCMTDGLRDGGLTTLYADGFVATFGAGSTSDFETTLFTDGFVPTFVGSSTTGIETTSFADGFVPTFVATSGFETTLRGRGEESATGRECTAVRLSFAFCSSSRLYALPLTTARAARALA